MKYLLILLTTLFLFSCNSDPEKDLGFVPTIIQNRADMIVFNQDSTSINKEFTVNSEHYVYKFTRDKQGKALLIDKQQQEKEQDYVLKVLLIMVCAAIILILALS